MNKRSYFNWVKIDLNGNIIANHQGEAECFIETISNNISLEMVKIPAGSFLIGSPDNQSERRRDEGPQRIVKISAFYLSKFPITQLQWRAIIGTNPAYHKGDDLPVERVSWHDANQFCQKLSEQTSRNYRLPSEAEWEYACRAGSDSAFTFGESINTEVANYNGFHPYGMAAKGRLRDRTTSVGFYQVANACGLYDMHENVREWCQDIWQPRYDLWQKTYKRAPSDGRDWEIIGSRDSRIARGGCYLSTAAESRSAARAAYPANDIHNYLGFRVAVVLE